MPKMMMKNTALIIAANHNKVELVKLLLEEPTLTPKTITETQC